jgi:GT2 family glycosyltransferase
MTPTFGCVILTMGKRPKEFAAALESLKNQSGVDLDIVVVGNGWDPAPETTGVKTVFLPENLGIPAGRNAGAAEVSGEYLFFLDDDVKILNNNVLGRFAEILQKHIQTGLLQPRIVGAGGGQTPRRWIPRLIIGDPMKPSLATTLAEGAVVIRRKLFDEIGGWPANFYYGHEGIELVWQVYNRGYTAWYITEVSVEHPIVSPTRHEYFYRLNARNRVWLARRNLPFPIGQIYLLNWFALSVLRMRSFSSAIAWLKGFSSGFLTNPGRQKKLSWKAIWKLTRAGRPPII